MSNLLGIKKILTYKLINIIRPFFYEGVLSVYLDAANISSNDNVLMVFQGLLSKIPKWSDAEIDKEVDRIKGKCKCPYFDNLLRSVLKINISIFLDETKDTFVEPTLYEKISLRDFIHKSYVLIARRIFNNPLLFYTELRDVDKLSNMNKILEIIGNEIENSIIELLPLDYLIDEFLNVEIYDKQLNLKVPNESIKNLEQIKNQLNIPNTTNNIKLKLVNGENNVLNNEINNATNNLLNPLNNIDPHPLPIIPVNGKQLFPVQMQMGGNKNYRNDIRNRSKGRTKYSEDDSSRTYSSRTSNSRRDSSSDRLERNVKRFLSNSKYDESAKIDNIIKNKHNEARKIGNKALDTSVSYDIDNVDRFQEVFSNDREVRGAAKNIKNIKSIKNNINFTNSRDNNLFTNNSKAAKSKKSRKYRHFHKV